MSYKRHKLAHHDRTEKFNPAFIVPRQKSRKRGRRNRSRHVDQPPNSAQAFQLGDRQGEQNG